MPYQVLLSDADQTLFDFHRGERHAITETFSQFRIDATEENIALYHRINEALWKLLEKGKTTSEKLRVERFAQFLHAIDNDADPMAMCAIFIERLSQQRFLIDGAKAFCEEISKHMPIILVTNGISVVQRSRFLDCELAPYITDIVISEEVGQPKPSPAMIYKALELAKITDRSKAIMLGDSLTSDIAAAKNAKVESILFTNGNEPPSSHEATYVAKSLSDAQSIILDNSACLFQ